MFVFSLLFPVMFSGTASEALNPRETLARRVPALVAFIFGLVHGLGFAGALKEIDLPESRPSPRVRP